ncbi:MAG: plastocyanin [Marmoricola sp.]|jgi:plastocyanin|nr:plastocyanin [Marmoricola sp.]
MNIPHMTRWARGVAVAAAATLVLTPAAGATVAKQEASWRAVKTAPAAHTWRVRVGSESKDMAIAGMRFLPGRITINAGDTVTWVARSAEIHTVTFLRGGAPRKKLPEFDPSKPWQVTRQGGSVYSPGTRFNSGLMTTVPTGGDAGPLPPVPHVQRYQLTFPRTGTFTYYCLVHGVMMVGTVHVNATGTPYPLTQAQYDARATRQAARLVQAGKRLNTFLVRHSSRHKVFAGGDNGAVSLMRFLRRTVVVRVGQSVSWAVPGMVEPHTVTFGKEPAGPKVFVPSGDPTHYSGGDLNSGLMVPRSTFRVTFTKAGSYPYVCALHDFMGMRGKVVVRP